MHNGGINLLHIYPDFHRVSSDRALRIGIALKGEGKRIVCGFATIHIKSHHYPMIAEIKLLGCGVGGIEDMVILTVNGKETMPGKGLLLHRIHTHLLNLNGIPRDGYAAIHKGELHTHIASNAFCSYSYFNSWHSIVLKMLSLYRLTASIGGIAPGLPLPSEALPQPHRFHRRRWLVLFITSEIKTDIPFVGSKPHIFSAGIYEGPKGHDIAI